MSRIFAVVRFQPWSSSSAATRHRVVALVVPGMSPLEIAVASEFLGVDRPELASVGTGSPSAPPNRARWRWRGA